MSLRVVYFVSLLSATLALTPAMAHLLELPNKIGLPADRYLIVQQNYRGWALTGAFVIVALLSTLVLTIMLRGRGAPFVLALVAFLCIAGTQVIFRSYTFPVNQETSNWTVLPANWVALRQRWEYSHAASAGLDLVAVTALILSVLAWANREPMLSGHVVGPTPAGPGRDGERRVSMALRGALADRHRVSRSSPGGVG